MTGFWKGGSFSFAENLITQTGKAYENQAELKQI